MNISRKQFFLRLMLAGLHLIFSNYITCHWAMDDLIFAKETIIENHPGIYNNLDPEFSNNVNLFFNDAQTKLCDAQDENTCKQILHDFGKSFDDVHLRIVFPQENSGTAVQESAKRVKFSCDRTDTLCCLRIPTFTPNQEEVASIEFITNEMINIRNMPYIMFDVRGNSGGNAVWGKQMTDSLFGTGYTHHKRAWALEKQYVEWRASASNITYLNTDLKRLIHKNFGKDSKIAEWVEHITDGMQKAYAAGDMLYRDYSNKFHETSDVSIENSLYTGTIIVIIDGHCVSACLGFIDELKLMGTTVVLVGKTTGADSLYMECRSLSLPSGKGLITFPIKVYRNRPRGQNVPYTPDVEYSRDINDTQALYSYISDLVRN